MQGRRSPSSPGNGGIQQVSRPNVTSTRDGRVWLAWLDGRPVDRTGDYLFNVALRESRDDARSFTPSWVVKGNACQCCRPALAQRPGDPNTMALVWRDVIQQPGTENHPMQMDGMDSNGTNQPGMVYAKTDDRRVKVAISHDGGHDFGAASSVGDFDWYLQACPTIGPSIFYDSAGKTMGVAWFNGSSQHTGVYYAQSTDGGLASRTRSSWPMTSSVRAMTWSPTLITMVTRGPAARGSSATTAPMAPDYSARV